MPKFCGSGFEIPVNSRNASIIGLVGFSMQPKLSTNEILPVMKTAGIAK